jgi:hypothetical protein
MALRKKQKIIVAVGKAKLGSKSVTYLLHYGRQMEWN